MNNLLNKFAIYIFFINILSFCVSENLDSVQGVLNQPSQYTVSFLNGHSISYNYEICWKRFLQIRIQSELKGNEFVSIKSKSDKYELRIKNQHNLPKVVAKVIICSSFQLNGCGNNETSIIELRTNAERNLLVILNASLNEDFTINIGDKKTDVIIDNYSPIYYLLKFNDTNKDMEVKINSDDDPCMHAFIEKAECSANILTPHLESVRVKTITKKGTILIKNRGEYVNNSLFLAFKINDSCAINGKSKQFNITFQNIDTNYSKPFWILVLLYCLAGIIYAIVYRIIWFCDENGFQKSSCCSDKANNKENGCVPCSRSGYFECWSFQHFLPSKYIFIISIFYILPTTQLLYHYITIMDVHGNFDLCYYNDQCSKPYWIFLAFNNVISNIGFVIMGIFYIIIVFIRHHCISSEKAFVSPNYGIFYALGLSLIMEGIVSGIYHICPRSNTIQFDLTFMYIIGCLLNLYYAIQIMTIFETNDNTITVKSTLKNDTAIIAENEIIEIPSGDLIVTVDSRENKVTINAKKNIGINNVTNNTVMIDSKYKTRPNVSEDYTVSINSTNDCIKLNFEDNIGKMHPRINAITKYHNIKIKEMFIYMSLVMFALILILIFAENNSGTVWIVIGFIQSIIILMYCCRIFCSCKCDIATLDCRITCFFFVIIANLVIFLLGYCLKWPFYFYFLVAIIGNSAILAVEYYCIKFIDGIIKKQFLQILVTRIVTCCQSQLSKQLNDQPNGQPNDQPNGQHKDQPNGQRNDQGNCRQNRKKENKNCCSILKSIWCKHSFIIINFIFAALFVGFAIDSFLKAPTEWTKPASYSREINQECIWWNFYDIHDKWHVLASIAIFLIYMFIFLMDSLIYEENERKMDSLIYNEKKEENQTVKNIVKLIAFIIFVVVGIFSMAFLFK